MNVAVWSTAGLVLPLASGLLMIVAMFALNMACGYFVESRSKRQFAEPSTRAQFINESLTAMSPAIRSRRGTLDKELRLWQQALKLYRAQNWEQAELALFNLQRLAEHDELYATYARRVIALRANPPGQGWDGVTTFETK